MPSRPEVKHAPESGGGSTAITLTAHIRRSAAEHRTRHTNENRKTKNWRHDQNLNQAYFCRQTVRSPGTTSGKGRTDCVWWRELNRTKLNAEQKLSGHQGPALLHPAGQGRDHLHRRGKRSGPFCARQTIFTPRSSLFRRQAALLHHNGDERGRAKPSFGTGPLRLLKPFPQQVRIDPIVQRNPRYRHIRQKALSHQTRLRRRIILPAAVAENTPDNQMLLSTLSHLVSTSVRWTPHATIRSIKKGAPKLALTADRSGGSRNGRIIRVARRPRLWHVPGPRCPGAWSAGG